MNFMTYGKTARSGVPASRNAFIPEKYWAPTKPNNRHDLFFRPLPEDLEENTQKTRNADPNDTVLTIKATSFFNREESTLYMAITEGRGNASCEVGIAAVDIKRPELIMSQISDNFWYTGLLTKIAILSPTEILLPQALMNSSNTSKLYLYIKHTYPDVTIRAVPRRQFNDRKALEIIDHIHNSKYKSIRDMIAKKYYALTASSALLQYLECIQNYSFAPNSLKIRYESKYGCMTIDLDTSHHLELLYPTCKTKEQRACLFGVLNSCVTGIGKRNLRAQILQPSCELKQILKTQECIKELIGNQDLFLALEAILTKFHSVDKLMKFAIVNTVSDVPNSSETMISQILQLKACLENIPELNRLLASINNSFFDDMKMVLVNTAYKEMLDEIATVIHPNVQITGGTTQFFQRLHAVNTNISSYLDLNRENYSKLVNKMNEIIGDLSSTHNLPFSMKFITSKGFHIQLTVPKNSAFPQLPTSFEVLSKTKNSINLTTNELRMLNLRMFDVVQQIHIESNRIITEMVNGIRHNMAHLYDLCGLVSSLDIILSLTKYSINSNGCCPAFCSEMNVIDGIHPLLEYNRCKTTAIPNGVIANSEYHFFVITGPNMGGKTIYLKMIAMLQILAQLGCFVPAAKAKFRLTDKILSRIGFGDRIECNLSGFVLEMRETEYIFKNITPNSLVIIDELCRSTNAEEGEVLAWAICERFIRLIGVSNDGQYFDESETPSTSKSSNKSLKLSSITSPFIFFVTHFDSITKLQDKFLSVVNLHFSATEETIDGKTHLTYTYRIEDGVNQLKNYGISLAQYMNFPPDVISNSLVISEELRQKQLPERPNKSNGMNDSASLNRRTTYRSTLLETSTSEHSHLLRLFYNLYADMVSINRLLIPIEEKQEILTGKMRELADDLPLHILEMAKKGNLFDIFKQSPNVATNFWSPPEPEIVEAEPLQADAASHTTTDFALLSQNSIARRIGLELQDTSVTNPFATPQVPKAREKAPVQLRSRVQFSIDPIDEMENPQPYDDCFSDRRHSGRDTATSQLTDDDNDLNFNFLDGDVDFIDPELEQYFSDKSQKQSAISLADEPYAADFLIPDTINKNDMFGNISDGPRSHQNTSTEAQPAVSSKDYTKSKSSNMNISQRSTSSSSSGLFRLRLKSPLKVRDNRILKTPPKSSRTQSVPSDEFTFGRPEESTQQRSISRLPSFHDRDFSGVEIPLVPSSSSSDRISGEFLADHIDYSGISQQSNHSPTQSFHLNLTQFFSKEAPLEDSFFHSTQDFQPQIINDTSPLPSSTSKAKFRTTQSTAASANDSQNESFVFPVLSQISIGSAKVRGNQCDDSYADFIDENQLPQLTRPAATQTVNFFNSNSNSNDNPCDPKELPILAAPQTQTGNFFNLKTVNHNPYDPKELPTLNPPFSESFIRKVTVAPKITPPTALQFIQYAYGNESDDDSSADEEESQCAGTSAATVNMDNVKVVTNPVPAGKQDKIQPYDSSANNVTANVETVENIILPVPSQFL